MICRLLDVNKSLSTSREFDSGTNSSARSQDPVDRSEDLGGNQKVLSNWRVTSDSAATRLQVFSRISFMFGSVKTASDHPGAGMNQ